MPVMSVDGCGVGGRFGRGMIGVERGSLTGRVQDASRGIGSSESGCEGGQGDKNNVRRALSQSGGVAWALLCRSLNKHDHAVSCPLVIGWPDRSIDGAGHLTSNESVTTGAWAS